MLTLDIWSHHASEENKGGIFPLHWPVSLSALCLSSISDNYILIHIGEIVRFITYM